MKHHHVFIFVSCIIASLWGSASARAITTIDPGDSILIALSGLPPATTFVSVEAQMDLFPPLASNTTLHMALFNSGNSLVTDGIFSFSMGSPTLLPTLAGPIDNTGHLVIDQISGPIGVNDIIEGGINAAGEPAVSLVQFQVTAPTPLPATLPLFATGLGALGLHAWRRKRKANAA